MFVQSEHIRENCSKLTGPWGNGIAIMQHYARLEFQSCDPVEKRLTPEGEGSDAGRQFSRPCFMPALGDVG